MTSPSIDEPTTLTPSVAARETRPPIRGTASSYLQSLNRAEQASSASTPSTSDWVSPFTLPALPVFQRARDRTAKSPESHQRANSSISYAAAWGSPYASTPSRTLRSPATSSHSANKSVDSAAATSPPRYGGDWLQSFGARGASVAQYLYSPKRSEAKEVVSPIAEATGPLSTESERPNWLSDSEGSETEIGPGKDRNKTPTRPFYSKLRSSSFAQQQGGHRNRQSSMTVTPENFNVEKLSPQQFKGLSTTEISNMAALGRMHERYSGDAESRDDEKPLPFLPPRRKPSRDGEMALTSPTSPQRPRLGSVQSFQRSKRQVLWRGKKCVIALPLEDREESGLPPLLTSIEIRDRMDKWHASGYNTDGFILGDGREWDVPAGSGHSRSLFPDPADVSQERQKRNFNVSIPDQAQWNAWVDYLKEERLRALGVSSSTSEPAQSVKSSKSPVPGHKASQQEARAISPPVPSSSVASFSLRATSQPFSPPFMPSTGASSQAASIASPSQAGQRFELGGDGKPNSETGSRVISPVSVSNENARSLPTFVPQSSNVSPAGLGSLPSLGEVLSPVSPFAVDDYIPPAWDHSSLLQMRQQQQRKAQNPPSAPIVPASNLPRAPSQLPGFEIAHPTPRSHRHNLSEALQHKVDYDDASQPKDRLVSVGSKRDEAELPEDEHDALPILHRPEIPQAEDDGDIITNPSNEGSPAPVEEHARRTNMFVRVLSSTNLGRGHKVQPTISKLNVEAPIFDPTAFATGSKFAFGGSESSAFSFKPALPPRSDQRAQRVSSLPPFAQPHLNVDAPAFTPSFATKSPPSIGAFTFNATAFNVNAPVFEPSTSVSEKFATSNATNADLKYSSSRIFGDVVIDPSSKASRRPAKPVTAGRPRSKEGPQDQSDDDENIAEDDEGRPQAPIERQKRARRGGSDGDRSPVFADSAPFGNRAILSEILNSADARRASVSSFGSSISADSMFLTNRAILSEIVNSADTKMDLASPAKSPVAADEKQQSFANDLSVSDTLQLREDEKSPSNPWSPFAARSSKEATEYVAPRPTSRHGESSFRSENHERDIDDLPTRVSPRLPLKSTEIVDSDSPTSELESASPVRPMQAPSEHPPEPALARTPERSSSPPRQQQPRRSLGLMASRFAPTPSPPSSPSSPRQNISSPPSDLYSYIKPEEASELLRIDENVPRHTTISPPRDRRSPHQDGIIVEIEETDDEQDARSRSMSISETSDHGPGDVVPSYEEIDAVMKHLDENPELGVERAASPLVLSTPLADVRLLPNIRSDAPSPSPRRAELAERRFPNRSPQHSQLGLGIGIHKLTDGTETVSDWNGAMSPNQEDRLQSRAGFFDGHVNDLVDNILETRLGPLEETLKTIQHSLANLANRPRSQHGRRSMSTDNRESDADDEDEYETLEGYPDQRMRSPMSRRDNRPDRIKQAVMEAMASYRPAPSESSRLEMSQMQDALSEMRELARGTAAEDRQAELKKVVENVIATHPRLRGQRITQSSQSDDKVKLQVHGLEAMLKVANERVDDEVELRHRVEGEIAELKHRLRLAEESAAQHRESSEEAERSLQAFVREKEVNEDLEQNLSDLEEENKALKKTLEEYRTSHDHWQSETQKLKEQNRGLADEVDRAHNLRNDRHHEERHALQREIEDFKHALRNAKDQLHESTRSREAYRDTLERLRSEMANLAQTVASERSEWQKADHESRVRHSTMSSTVEQERRRREKLEDELDDRRKDDHETDRLRTSHTHAREELSRLQEHMLAIREENRAHQDNTHRLERELIVARDTSTADVEKSSARVEARLQAADEALDRTRTDAEAVINRLQNRLETAELDLEDQKAKHDATIAEISDTHKQTLQEAIEKREAALEEQHASHDRKLNDLRERHTRALHNSSDDRHRLEHNLNEKLSLSDDKVKYLEMKVTDLEERLEITKSAARAAVEAVTKRPASDLPTPAPSTMASPPNHPSLSFIRGSELPEKISPQALRESILVLQDQLQHREQAMEKLEQELAAVDKDAPRKVQGLETELSWLRELLNVRVDDIDVLVQHLSTDDESQFDRVAIRDTAIRLKANIAMETQIRERAMAASTALASLPASIANNLPSSIASLSTTLTQSPRALPLAAAAAWGNWRKGRDFSSFGASLPDLTGAMAGSGMKTTVPGTPTRSPAGSSSFLSSMASPSTPSALSFKSPPPDITPVPARPLAAFGKARNGSTSSAVAHESGTMITPRPLRAYSAQPRTLSSRNKSKEIEIESPESVSGTAVPSTPIHIRRVSSPAGDLMEDVDDDAKSLDGRGQW